MTSRVDPRHEQIRISPPQNGSELHCEPAHQDEVVRVIADDHKGLRAAASKVFHATLRCRVHFTRNALAYAGKTQRRFVPAWVGTAFAQDDATAARRKWREVADQARPRVPKLAAIWMSRDTTDGRSCCLIQKCYRGSCGCRGRSFRLHLLRFHRGFLSKSFVSRRPSEYHQVRHFPPPFLETPLQCSKLTARINIGVLRSKAGK